MSDMKPSNDTKEYFFDRPEVVQWILRALYSICALLVVIDVLAVLHIGVHRHIEHPLENIPAYYPLYGFIGCVVLVLIAKEMRKVLMRKADYYDERDD